MSEPASLESQMAAAWQEFEEDLDAYLAEWEENLRSHLAQAEEDSPLDAKLGESLLEAGFTGTITDKRGRKRHYVDGKEVKGGAASTTGAQARKKAKAAAASNHPHANLPDEERKGVLAKLKALGAAALAAGKTAAGAILARVPKPVRAVAAGAFHVMEYGFSKGKQLAEEVARERHHDPAHAARAAKWVAYVDQALAWTVAMPVVHHLAHEAHLDEVASLAVAKASAFMPLASLTYVAYSTLRNPLAVIRAAKKVLQSKSHPHESQRERLDGRAWLGDLLDFLAAAPDADQAEALLAVALDQTHDPAEALRLASAALGR